MKKEQIIIDDELSYLYMRTKDRFVIATHNNDGEILAAASVDDVDEVRDYIRDTKSLLDGKYYGRNLPIKKVPLEELEAWFSLLERKNLDESEVNEKDEKEKSDIAKKLNFILTEAANKRCSDIHIEIYKDVTKVLFRIDGLRSRHTAIDGAEEGLRIARNIFYFSAEQKDHDFTHELTNNGNIREFLEVDGTRRETLWRVAWTPSDSEGGKLTFRWLNRHKKIPTLEQLRWERGHIEQAERFRDGDSGLMIVAGKTGSGKTTAIAAIIDTIGEELSIHTFEDPPEFKLTNAIQTHLKPNKVHEKTGELLDQDYYGRATLRHDPDVEWHGEVRTPSAALQISRKGDTGQKVLTTVHTSFSYTVPSTLIHQMNLPPSLVALPGLVKLIVYQALVRQLCPHCKLDHTEWSESASDKDQAYVIETAKYIEEREGLKYQNIMNSLHFANPKGCKHCIAGVYDRLPLVEMIVLDDEDREYISECRWVAWKKHLYDKGFKDIKSHGIVRLMRGEVDLFSVESRIGHIKAVDSTALYGSLL